MLQCVHANIFLLHNIQRCDDICEITSECFQRVNQVSAPGLRGAPSMFYREASN